MTPAASRSGLTQAPARLLLVDDEESVLLTLAAILRQQGYEVTAVGCARAAREALRDGDFDLIVTDLRMEEETSGLRVLAAARERDPQATGIILTGYASFPSAVEALQAGVSDYLTKPSNIEQLKLAIANALEKRRMARALIQAERGEAARAAAERGREEAERARQEAEEARALAQRFAQEQAVAREAAERHAGRLAFLSAAGVELASSLDLDVVLAKLARLAVPYLADWCVVELFASDDHEPRRLAVAHVDPAREELAREIQRRSSIFGAELRQVVTAGEVYQRQIAPGDLERPDTEPDVPAMLASLHPRSILAAPLLSEGRVLGVLSFLLSESDRAYEPQDVAVCQDLGRRAGVTIQHRRLYHQRETERDRMAEFLGAAAHDLRTPLTAIKGWVQLLRREVATLDGAGGKRIGGMTEAVDEAATRMSGLMNELLDVSQLDSHDHLTLSHSATDLVQLARRVVNEHRRVAERHNLRVEARPRSLNGDWDAPRLERVLSNLLSNAVKYSPAGGDVVVSLDRERQDGRAWAVLSVRDRGLGIPGGDVERVFERFQRGENVREQIPGTGIGLAYAREIVLLHGGTISVESHEGAGSTFTVRLPIRGR